jgi:hypothetical protein
LVQKLATEVGVNYSDPAAPLQNGAGKRKLSLFRAEMNFDMGTLVPVNLIFYNQQFFELEVRRRF